MAVSDRPHAQPSVLVVRDAGEVAVFDALMKLGVRPVKIMPAMNPVERINALRIMLARSRFDAVKSRVGLKALWHYRRERNPGNRGVPAEPGIRLVDPCRRRCGVLAIGIEEKAKVKVTPLRTMPLSQGSTSWMSM